MMTKEEKKFPIMGRTIQPQGHGEDLGINFSAMFTLMEEDAENLIGAIDQIVHGVEVDQMDWLNCQFYNVQGKICKSDWIPNRYKVTYGPVEFNLTVEELIQVRDGLEKAIASNDEYLQSQEE